MDALEKMFGYGVKPQNVIASWLVVVGLFAMIYYPGSGLESRNVP